MTHFYKERSATKFNRDTEDFFNTKLTKVEVTVKGVPNELYAQNMEYRHQYDEILKHFGEGRLKKLELSKKIYSCTTSIWLHTILINMPSGWTFEP